MEIRVRPLKNGIFNYPKEPGFLWLKNYLPDPVSTAKTVMVKILKSSLSDQLSMYLRSISIQSAKLIWLRFREHCQRQVRPGFIDSRLRCHISYFSTSEARGGARTHYAQLTFQNVDELRHFIQAGSSEKGPDVRNNARVFFDFKNRSVALV